MNQPAPTFVDFFAGSGLVTQGVKHACAPVWSNDICPKKAAIYTANHGDDHFHLGSIEQISGTEIPITEGQAFSHAVERFSGAGVYAIYYTGDFDTYSKLRDWNTSVDDLNVPIYVGKAVPTGGRKGNIGPEVSAKGAALFSRLDEHRKSIEQATNLEIADFWCRYLVVDDIWITQVALRVTRAGR